MLAWFFFTKLGVAQGGKDYPSRWGITLFCKRFQFCYLV